MTRRTPTTPSETATQSERDLRRGRVSTAFRRRTSAALVVSLLAHGAALILVLPQVLSGLSEEAEPAPQPVFVAVPADPLPEPPPEPPPENELAERDPDRADEPTVSDPNEARVETQDEQLEQLEEPAEEEDEPALEVVEAPPQPPQQDQLPSAFQPDPNSEAPEIATALAEHDNTVAEETVAIIDNPVIGEAQVTESSETAADERGEEGTTEEVEPLEADDTNEASDTRDQEQSEQEQRREEVAAQSPEVEVAPPTPSAEDAPAVEDETADEAVELTTEEVAPLDAETVLERLSISNMMNDLAERSERTDEDGETLIAQVSDATASSYNEVFGDQDAMARERLEQSRRENSLVGDHEGEWEQLVGALNNFDVSVTAGTETHINTRSDAFAPYVNLVHNRIHPRWTSILYFWDLHEGVASDLSDSSLQTTLEYVIDRDGDVEDVNIIGGSGVLRFDAEAVRILQSIGPHEPPPPAMLSSDGLAYIHWRFARDQRQCGTFGATVRFRGSGEPSDGG